MNNKPTSFETSSVPLPEDDPSLAKGWRVKAWKGEQEPLPAEPMPSPSEQASSSSEETPSSAQQIKESLRSLPAVLAIKAKAAADKKNRADSKRRYQQLGMLGAGSAAILLVLVAGLPSSGSDASDGSKPAIAETAPSEATSAETTIADAPIPATTLESRTIEVDQPATLQPAVARVAGLNRGYLLHLGSYQSELSAQLMWAGLEANAATLLKGFDPIFLREEGEGYVVLAGSYASRDDARGHCAWLNAKQVSCLVVDGLADAPSNASL